MQCLHRITTDKIYGSFALRTTDLSHATARNEHKKRVKSLLTIKKEANDSKTYLFNHI